MCFSVFCFINYANLPSPNPSPNSLSPRQSHLTYPAETLHPTNVVFQTYTLPYSLCIPYTLSLPQATEVEHALCWDVVEAAHDEPEPQP